MNWYLMNFINLFICRLNIISKIRSLLEIFCVYSLNWPKKHIINWMIDTLRNWSWINYLMEDRNSINDLSVFLIRFKCEYQIRIVLFWNNTGGSKHDKTVKHYFLDYSICWRISFRWFSLFDAFSSKYSSEKTHFYLSSSFQCFMIYYLVQIINFCRLLIIWLVE